MENQNSSQQHDFKVFWHCFLAGTFAVYIFILCYRDAVCLAQVRLGLHDPVLKQLFASWAVNLAKEGNYELAAKWFVSSHLT
jgi:hypothetical protein